MRPARIVALAAVLVYAGLAAGSEIQVAQGDVYVNGYPKRDGTYVQPHHQSAPDGNPYNNYGFPGNTNPYTGKVAPGNPDTYLRTHDNGGGFGQMPKNPYSMR